MPNKQQSIPNEFSKEDRQKQANDIIIRRTMYAAGTGLIPIPILDAAALLGVQVYMLRDIAQTYEVEFKEQRVKSFIGILIGDAAAISLFKLVPGLGTFFGGASVAAIGAASTYALGKVFVKHFEEGGTFLDFSPEKSKAYFDKQVQEGKKVVQSIRKKGLKKASDQPDKDKKGSYATITTENQTLSQEILTLRKELEILREQRQQKSTGQSVTEVVEKVPENIDFDDLKVIKGIGPKISEVLNSAGIQNINDLATATPEKLNDILEQAEGNFTLALPDTWILQAQLIKEGNISSLEAFQQQLSKEH